MCKENDTVILKKETAGNILGDNKVYLLPKGILATIVSVYGSSDCPDAYEVEVYISEFDCYVLATIPANDI